MKFYVPELFLLEFVVYFLFLFTKIFEDHNKQCRLRKIEQFSKCSFVVNLCSQSLTTSPYIWN